jgi:hypothetical protein
MHGDARECARRRTGACDLAMSHFMSRGFAETIGEPLKINGNMSQQISGICDMKKTTNNYNYLIQLRIIGALGEIRTPDPQIRSPMVGLRNTARCATSDGVLRLSHAAGLRLLATSRRRYPPSR